ncbi:uncharacterized protein PGTG_22421 [Puccinia graminis f. sp. tritici CRL 75-36-700-3]|uniref:Uncharacterized protein n=1 Tax=Puccinia graminis f. sp. tritici (strain CRL 75-36-700-3 / race SCCL) TaxID=418459 RepID=H6QUL1_PUCGT|nr:uncharacterized protein PGTG_22421 [Puccinia graminis f. sp. tritici CRL 75-36-700-3]EHS64725.1 hypothetical protein PGTG_22421 [Puccinia graminis f. sp. tritici CRL 75-36-700-3]
MAARLLDRTQEENGSMYYKGGLISDVTYRFFDTGYLLTTSMYCQQINRWIPIQLSWIRGLSENYYKIHFATLFRQFMRPEILDEDRKDLARNIVDFSKAQSEGFISAYLEVFGGTDRVEARNKLKGCKQHYRASITRIKRNRAVIMADEVSVFERMCESLLVASKEGSPTHEQKIDEIRRRFPKVKKWIDWWTMADVEAMLFPSRNGRLEDSPNDLSGLPDTTNAQESMHRVYYMLSNGKKSLMIGLIELFAFVKALERDWEHVRRGMTIAYGSLPSKQVDVAQSVGWTKLNKRQKSAVNDGRPPDTSEQLLSDLERAPKRAKLGRPKNSPNIIKNTPATYTSYVASNQPKARNRCWLAAALESLYAVYSPLWLQEPGGKKDDLFFFLISHFTCRTTYEMTRSTQVRSILTRGSNKLFNEVHKLFPESFVHGEFASLDFFVELMLDPTRNKSKMLPKLFQVEENRKFTCTFHPGQQQHPRGSRTLSVIKITKSMFDTNNIRYSNFIDLFNQWTNGGLLGVSGLQCRKCISKSHQDGQPSPNTPTFQSYLSERSTLSFLGNTPPAHLYFHVEVAPILSRDTQQEIMGGVNWPFKLTFRGEEYTLISRGFWTGAHYWGKVLRHFNGLTGVWLHDDHLNGGFAQLVSQVPGSISGAHPDTSSLIYSRCWTPTETQFIDNSIVKIKRDNPKVTISDIPFVNMQAVICSAFDSALPHLTGNPIPPPEPVPSVKITSPDDDYKLDGNQMEIDSQACKDATLEPPSERGLKIRIKRTKPTNQDSLDLAIPLDSQLLHVSGAPTVSLTPSLPIEVPPKTIPATTPAKRTKKTRVPKELPKIKIHQKEKFVPAPLTSADWNRLASVSRAYWDEHWEAKGINDSAVKPVASTANVDLKSLHRPNIGQADPVPAPASKAVAPGCQGTRRSLRRRVA